MTLLAAKNGASDAPFSACMVNAQVVAIISVSAGSDASAANAASDKAAAPTGTGPAPTVVLDSKNFDDKVSYWGEDEWLLEFYAPWCTHCQHFAPTYDKIAFALEPVGKKVAKIDCVAARDICTRFGVSGYPTIKLYVLSTLINSSHSLI